MSSSQVGDVSYVRKSIARDTALIALSQIGARGSLIVAGMVVSQFLGPGAFSGYSFLLLTSVLIVTMTGMGLGLLATRAAASGPQVHGEQESSRIRALFMLTLVSATLGVCAAAIVPDDVVHHSSLIERGTLVALTLAGSLNGVLLGLLSGGRRYTALLAASTVGGLTTIAAAILGAATDSYNVALLGLALGQAATLAIASVASFPMVRLALVPGFPNALWTSTATELLRTALPVVLTSVTWTSVIWWAGRRLLLAPDGEMSFSLYAIGFHWFSAAVFVPGALNAALLPRLFNRATRANSDQRMLLPSFALRGALAASAIAVPVALIVFALQTSGLLSQWYAIEAGLLAPVIYIFMAAAVLAAACGIVGNAVIALFGAAYWLFAILVWASTYFAFSHALGPLSAVSTATSLAAAYLLLACVGVMLLKARRLPLR